MKKALLASAIPAIVFAHPALSQEVFALDEIVFTVNVDDIDFDRVGTSVTVIEADELADAGDQQLTDYLAQLPGISLTQSGGQGQPAILRIRGAHSRYVSVYVDGILVTDPAGLETSYEDFGGLTTGGLRRIEILRGSQSALYGGTAVGGVINITTLEGSDAPEGTTQTFSLEGGSYDTLAASYGLTQRTGALTLGFNADHFQTEGFSAADEDNGNTEADGATRSRVSLGMSYEISDALTFGLNGFVESGSSEADDFQSVPPYLPEDGTTDDDSSRDTVGLRASLGYDDGTWRHDGAISLYEIERSIDSDGFVNSFEGRRIAVDYSGSVLLSDALTLSFGTDLRYEEGTFSLTGLTEDTTTVGLFGEAVWSPTANLDITGTLRQDEHSVFGGQTTGRLGVAWRPQEGTVLRGAISTGYRPPSIDELLGDYTSIFPYVGNPDLTPETSFSAEIGIDRDFGNGIEVSATAFLLEIEDLVTYCDVNPLWANPACPPVPGVNSTLFNVPGVSRRHGVELSGRAELSDVLTFTGAYTYTQAESATGDPIPRVPEHDIALGLDADFGNGWTAGLTAQHVSGLIDGTTDMPAWTVFDASLGYEVRDGLEAYVNFDNIFDESYQTLRGYGTAGRSVYVGIRASF